MTVHSRCAGQFWETRTTGLRVMAFLSLAAVATGTEPRTDLPLPVLTVGRATAPVTIDGKLSETAWADAVCIPMLQDWNTGAGVQPDTTVRVCWNDRMLYVAWDCREPRMDKLVAHTDGDVWQDDDVELFVQPPGRLDYRHFMVNALGRLQWEASLGTAYHPDARAAAQRGATGWTVELAVAWKSLGGPPKPGAAWHCNFNRVRKPKPEAFGCWAVTGGSFHNAKRFGIVRFADSAPLQIKRLDPGALTLGFNRAEFAGTATRSVGRGTATISLGNGEIVRRAIGPGVAWSFSGAYTVDLDAPTVLTCYVRSAKAETWYSRSFPISVPGRDLLNALQEERTPPAQGKAHSDIPPGLRDAFNAQDKAAQRVLDEARTEIRRAISGKRNIDFGTWTKALAKARLEKENMTRPLVWTRDPYSVTRPHTLPTALPGAVTLRIQAFRNEYETGALLVSNLRGTHALTLRVRLGALLPVPATAGDKGGAAPRADSAPLSPERLRLTEAVMIRTAANGRLTDAIVPLDRAERLFIPSGEARELRLTVNTFDARPGLYHGALGIQSMDPKLEPWTLRVPVAIRVWPVALATHTRISVFNFDYYRGGASDAFLHDLLAHRVNVFALRAPVPDPKTGIADFSGLDEPIARVKGHGMIFFESWFFRSQGWKPRYARWVRDLVAYMKSKGLGYDDWVLHIFDETLSDRFLDTARHIKKVDPALHLFSDRMGPPARIAEFAPVVDTWCPHFRDLIKPGFETMRRSGHPIWTYDCGSGKAISPTHNRALPWCAWHYKLDGVCYWTYFSNYGDPWNDFDQGHPDWSKVYTDSAGNPVSSKRWDAWRAGLEDWALFDLYAQTLKSAGGGKATAVDQELQQDIAAVGAAADAPADTLANIVDRVRRRVLTLRGIRDEAFPAFCDIAWGSRLAGDGHGRISRLPAQAHGPERQVGAFLTSPTARSWTFLIQPVRARAGDKVVLELRARGKGKLKTGICEGYRWGDNGAGHRTTLRFISLKPEWQSVRIEHTVGKQQPVEALVGFDYGNADAAAEARDYRATVQPRP